MNWLEELRSACASAGQKEIARRIGYSSAVLSQVLNGKYPGDLERVQAQVEGVLMRRVVDCPVLGEITLDICRGHQTRKPNPTNQARMMMHYACRDNCPHSLLCKEK